MLSLGGIPPTAGFMGKFWLFGAAIDAGYVWLAIIAVVNSVISLVYYIRVVVFMWIREERFGSAIVMGPALATAVVGDAAGHDCPGYLSAAAIRFRRSVGANARYDADSCKSAVSESGSQPPDTCFPLGDLATDP